MNAGSAARGVKSGRCTLERRDRLAPEQRTFECLTERCRGATAVRGRPAPLVDHDGAAIDDSAVAGAARVPAVTRAAAALNAVAAVPHGLSLADLARIVGAPKSSLLSVCLALTDERLLRRTEDGRYQLGLRVAELASAELLHPPRLTRIAVAVQTLANPFFAAEVQAVDVICRELDIAVAVSDARQDLTRQVQQLREIVERASSPSRCASPACHGKPCASFADLEQHVPSMSSSDQII